MCTFHNTTPSVNFAPFLQLTEIDHVVVFATSSRSAALIPSLRRAGRFDKEVSNKTTCIFSPHNLDYIDVRSDDNLC